MSNFKCFSKLILYYIYVVIFCNCFVICIIRDICHWNPLFSLMCLRLEYLSPMHVIMFKNALHSLVLSLSVLDFGFLALLVNSLSKLHIFFICIFVFASRSFPNWCFLGEFCYPWLSDALRSHWYDLFIV